MSPVLAGDSLPLSHQGSPVDVFYFFIFVSFLFFLNFIF